MLDPALSTPFDEVESPTKKVKVEQSRGRNATALADENPFDFDSRVTFTEEGHQYTVDGVAVHRSATALIKEAFVEDDFDATAIAQKNLPGWRAGRGQAKYQDVIHGLDDEAAIKAVVAMWDRDTKLGTSIHKFAELSYNGLFPESAEFAEVDAETKQFENFRQLTDLKIYRSELGLFYVNAHGVTIAGQADLLFKDPNGKFVLIDIKRTSHDLTADARAGNAQLKFPTTTKDNKFHRYSLQNSIYSVMLEFLTGQDVGVCHLLQLHEKQPGFVLIECVDLRTEARQLLEAVR